MSNSGKGSRYRVTGKLDDMAAYDLLPPIVRQALRNSNHNWSAKHVWVEMRRPKAKRHSEFNSPESIAKFIVQADKIKHARDAANPTAYVCP